MAERTKSPLVLSLILWHLLSLDAPSVAVLWTWFIAKACRVPLPHSSLLAMGIAVWVLYAADRLLDVRAPDNSQLEERHLFHLQYRNRFLTGILIGSLLLAVLLPQIPMEAIRLYLVLGGLVFGYFVVIHATSSAHRLPKEIAVGVCFAAAVFIPTISRAPGLRVTLLPAAVLFAALCSLNCLFIYEWEHASGDTQTPHRLTATALAHLQSLSGTVASASFLLALFNHRSPWQISSAIAVSAIALMLLHRRRRSHQILTLRTAADLALLAPVLIVVLL